MQKFRDEKTPRAIVRANDSLELGQASPERYSPSSEAIDVTVSRQNPASGAIDAPAAPWL
jgi:hypothetical protein